MERVGGIVRVSREASGVTKGTGVSKGVDKKASNGWNIVVKRRKTPVDRTKRDFVRR